MSKTPSKSSRLEISLPAHLKEALRVASERKGISMAEYIKDAVKAALAADKIEAERALYMFKGSD